MKTLAELEKSIRSINEKTLDNLWSLWDDTVDNSAIAYANKDFALVEKLDIIRHRILVAIETKEKSE